MLIEINDLVTINVGGMVFQTKKNVLLRKIKKPNLNEYYPNHKLYILTQRLADFNQNSIFIDYSPKYFEYILTYLRTDLNYFLTFLDLSNQNKYGLLIDAEYYGLIGLKDLLINNLKNSYLEVHFLDTYILTTDQFQNLFNICNFSNETKFRLIYRGSNNGFHSKNFHTRCDGPKETLSVIQTIDNFVFGGYINGNWSCDSNYFQNNIYGSDSKAFIFSLININQQPLIMKCFNATQAYFKSSQKLICFGMSDILIANNANENINSMSNLGWNYAHPEYKRGSLEAKTFLAGTNNFQVKEIEVYELLRLE